MSTYTKLFQSILDSSIWQESHQTRIVWVTMLAMADQHGEVQASVPGLAKRAGVTVSEAEDAIAVFSRPDRYSRTPDHEGRRIAKIDGGWEILNHAKYRFEASLQDRRDKALERQRRRRNGLQKVEGANPTGCDTALQSVTQRDLSRSVTLLDDKQKQRQKQINTPLPPEGEPWLLEFGLTLPEKFQTKECIEAARLWLQHKKERRQGYKKTGLQAMLTEWSNTFTAEELIEAISFSMAKNWSGVFKVTKGEAAGSNPKEALATRMRSHPGNPNHIAHSTATPEQLSEFSGMLERYRRMA
jgi:hypothetical protein